MLGITATHLSTCQELRDCKWPLCQTSCDGWVSLASRGSKAQEENERDKRRKKGVNVNIEYWKGIFSDTHRTCTEIHPEGGYKHKTRHWSVSSEIWKVCINLWIWGVCWAGLVSWFWCPGKDSHGLPILTWARCEPWGEPRLGNSHQAAPRHLSQSLPMWILDHGKVWRAVPFDQNTTRLP